MRKAFSGVMAVFLAIYITLIPARAEQGGKLVALTFDDGPSGKYTETLLDGLKERGVKVTFFVLGNSVQCYPEIVRRAAEEGHEIACHSWNHPDLTELDDEAVRNQFRDSFGLLDEITGRSGDYLVRPPYGTTDARVKEIVDRPLVCWSVDSRDWEYRDSDLVRERILEDVYDGAIILCHDIHGTTIPAALDVIDTLTEQGYEFVTVSELFRRRGVQMENGKLYYDCKANGTDLGPMETAVSPVPTESVAQTDPITQTNPPETTMPLPDEKAPDSGRNWLLLLWPVPLAAVALLLIRWRRLEEVRRFLNHCGEASGIRFRAEIAAQQGENVKKLTLDCRTEPDGAVGFTVISPERIAGASGTISAENGKLFRSDGTLRTVASPWMLVHTLRCGQLRGCARQNGACAVHLAAKFGRETVPVELRIRKGKLLSAKIHWQKRQWITMELSKFHLDF